MARTRKEEQTDLWWEHYLGKADTQKPLTSAWALELATQCNRGGEAGKHACEQLLVLTVPFIVSTARSEAEQIRQDDRLLNELIDAGKVGLWEAVRHADSSNQDQFDPWQWIRYAIISTVADRLRTLLLGASDWSGSDKWHSVHALRTVSEPQLPGYLGSKQSEGDREREQMLNAFLKRSFEALRRMAEVAPTEELAEALSTPTDIGGVAHMLSEVGSLQPENSSFDPLTEFVVKGAIRKRELLNEAGGTYSTAQVADLLGITRQAVQQRVRRGRLLALSMGSIEKYYPRIQFDDTGVVPGFERVLASFTVDDPWTRLSVLLDSDEALGGRRVIDALREGELELVLRIVRSFGG